MGSDAGTILFTLLYNLNTECNHHQAIAIGETIQPTNPSLGGLKKFEVRLTAHGVDDDVRETHMLIIRYMLLLDRFFLVFVISFFFVLHFYPKFDYAMRAAGMYSGPTKQLN